MPEKPIVFSGPMVRAIIEGHKTQTRRVIKPQPPEDAAIRGPEWYEPAVVGNQGELEPGTPVYGIYDEDGEWGIKCPYLPGTVLWVRETHYRWTGCNNPPPDWRMIDDNPYNARAYLDNEEAEILHKEAAAAVKVPSIHMPRAAARLFLKVTDVRVERLQEITEENARAEGVISLDAYINASRFGHRDTNGYTISEPITMFKGVWDSIYAKRGFGWDANPWVWVIEFEVITDVSFPLVNYRIGRMFSNASCSHSLKKPHRPRREGDVTVKTYPEQLDEAVRVLEGRSKNDA